MSSLKNANKKFQRLHRERSQPGTRRHLGYLEKKKDYKARAEDYQSKTRRLKELRKKALDRNPDEFYFHMINSEVKDGRHYEKKNIHEFSEDQLKIMQTRDIQYVSYKRTVEMSKIEKLKANLHMIHVEDKPCNTRIVFTDSGRAKKVSKKPKVASTDDKYQEDPGWKQRQKAYRELEKRTERLRQLTILLQKMQVKQDLTKSKGKQEPYKISDGDPDTAPVYLWPKERKR